MIPKPSASIASRAAPERRSRCERCGRPRVACICSYAVEVRSAVEVLILQHPLEVAHPKGSARLLHLSLPGSRLATGERFPEQALREWLYGPEAFVEQAPATLSRQPVLLYPDTAGSAAHSVQVQAHAMRPPARVRLVVLDGTWRKSLRMLHENPVLQTLPRLVLGGLPPSRYRIRQAYRAEQLSTLEATCHALSRLEENEAKYQPLLDAFERFIDAQQVWLPRA